jgi:hypothetical protein
MELRLEAFGQFLIDPVNSELIENKLFGVAVLENGELTQTHILEEDFIKYNHIILDTYPNSEEIQNKIKENNIYFPIVELR